MKRYSNRQFPWPLRDVSALKTLGVCSIPFECGTVCIEKPGCFIETRAIEHHQHIRLSHPGKSATAERNILSGH
jgi:hypothetical protein